MVRVAFSQHMVKSFFDSRVTLLFVFIVSMVYHDLGTLCSDWVRLFVERRPRLSPIQWSVDF